MISNLARFNPHEWFYWIKVRWSHCCFLLLVGILVRSSIVHNINFQKNQFDRSALDTLIKICKSFAILCIYVFWIQLNLFSSELKMRPLSTNRQVLTWLCIYPVDGENPGRKPLYLIISAISLITITSVLLSSAVFFFNNYSNDLKVSINAIYQMAAFFGVTYMYVNAIFMRKMFTKFLRTLEKIYEKRKI